MGCCGNQNHDHHQKELRPHEQQGSQHQSHKWFMILICVLPVVLAAVFLISKGTSGLKGNVLPLLLVFICPFSHLLMMPLMKQSNQKNR
jgi:hypothetical protein